VPLCAYADPLIQALRELVPAALKRGEAKAIHDSRVAARRLRAALDLVEPILSSKTSKPVRKTIKRLRRRLGVLRDLDVMIDHLTPLQRRQRHAQAALWLAEQFEHARHVARRAAQKKKNAPEKWLGRLGAWGTLRAEIVAQGDEVETRLRSSLLSRWRSFSAQADRLSANLLDSQPPGPDLPPAGRSAADPHQLRIAGKLLRYTFEMLAKTRNKPPATVKRAFKRMQDELGLWHDHVMLAEAAIRQSLESQLAHHDPEMHAKVLALATATLRTAERRLIRFATLWREKGPALSSVVEQVPPPHVATQSETGPGLFDSAPPPVTEEPPPGESSAA
jgi:CHAD domain-containing protein